MGLVLDTAPSAAEVLEKAEAIAASVVDASPLGVSLITDTLRMRDDEGLDAALRREADGQAASYASDEFKLKIDEMIAKTSGSK
jgi:enoyl-CoA hydratase/carnithine racemase